MFTEDLKRSCEVKIEVWKQNFKQKLQRQTNKEKTGNYSVKIEKFYEDMRFIQTYRIRIYACETILPPFWAAIKHIKIKIKNKCKKKIAKS